MPSPDPSKPIRLRDFAVDAVVLDTDTFRRRHADAFLVYEGSEGEWEAGPDLLQQTASIKLPKDPTKGASWHRLDYLVFPVRQARRSPFPNFITVGRLPTSDICIPDESLSKFHALFQRGADGELRLLDTSSNHATFVNGKPVPNRHQGDAVKLKSRDRLLIGSVNLIFFAIEDFRAEVVQACSRKRER